MNRIPAHRRARTRRLAALVSLVLATATSGTLAVGATPAHAATCPDTVFTGTWFDVDSSGAIWGIVISPVCNTTAPEYNLEVHQREPGGIRRRVFTGTWDGPRGAGTSEIRYGGGLLNPSTLFYEADRNHLVWVSSIGVRERLYRVTGCC